jgi:hypothetical protein
VLSSLQLAQNMPTSPHTKPRQDCPPRNRYPLPFLAFSLIFICTALTLAAAFGLPKNDMVLPFLYFIRQSSRSRTVREGGRSRIDDVDGRDGHDRLDEKLNQGDENSQTTA